MSAPLSLLLEAPDVRAVLSHLGRDRFIDLLTARLTETLRTFAPEQVQIPPRAGVQYANPSFGLLEWMPAYVGAGETLVKVVGYHPTNPEVRGVPTVISTMCLYDATGGHLIGIVDGTLLTALRTGAASAVATRILASPHSRVLGVIGCGAQAVTQIHALSRVLPLERIVAYDVRPDAARSLAARVSFVGVPVEVVGPEKLGDLVAGADVLCTCTSSAPGAGPVFPDGPTRPHLHVNAIGSDLPGKFEVPVELLRRGLVCPDFREQAVLEGECQQLTAEDIGPDLAALVQQGHTFEAARERITVFDSTGWALEDYVATRMMLECARELGRGRRVAVECLPPDPKDPYSLLESAESAAGSYLSAGRVRV
jgi:ornithine cyclodeaminase/alanine dehydrogenase-like protein (mu-crystallin family)